MSRFRGIAPVVRAPFPQTIFMMPPCVVVVFSNLIGVLELLVNELRQR
jgi:hypothetical protein